MKFLRQFIEDKIEIDDEEWKIASLLFTKKVYTQGEEIFSAGEVHDKLYYVSDGMIRMYSIDEKGKETTFGICYHQDEQVINPFSGDYISFLTQKESAFFGEVLCDTIVYIADFNALEKFYETGFKWMKLGKSISDEQLISVVENVRMMRNLSAKEKYLLLKELAPMYEEILPDYQFASVLGIAPQSLSRMKREMRESTA